MIGAPVIIDPENNRILGLQGMTPEKQVREALYRQLEEALVNKDEGRFRTIAFVHRHDILAALSHPVPERTGDAAEIVERDATWQDALDSAVESHRAGYLGEWELHLIGRRVQAALTPASAPQAAGIRINDQPATAEDVIALGRQMDQEDGGYPAPQAAEGMVSVPREMVAELAFFADEWDRWQAKGSTSTERMVKFNYGKARIDLAFFRRARALAAAPSAPPVSGDDGSDAEIVAVLRAAAKHVTGSNCAFADDDVALLAGLAERAIAAGLTDGLDVTVQRSLAASPPVSEKGRVG